MAKKRSKEAELLFARALMGLYIQHAIGVMKKDEEAELKEIGRAYGLADWKEWAAKELQARFGEGADRTFLRKVYRLALNHLYESEAAAFLLAGLGCPSPSDLVMLREQFVTGQL